MTFQEFQQGANSARSVKFSTPRVQKYFFQNSFYLINLFILLNFLFNYIFKLSTPVIQQYRQCQNGDIKKKLKLPKYVVQMANAFLTIYQTIDVRVIPDSLENTAK